MNVFAGKGAFLLGAISLLPAGRGLALEVPMTFRPLSSTAQDSLGEDAHRLARWTRPPAGNWKLPSFRAPNPLFSMVSLGGSRHLLVLDKKNPRAPFYDRLFFDSNGDGDLTNDPVVKGRTFSRGLGFFYATFPPLEVKLRLPGGPAPYRLEIRAHKRPSFRGGRRTGRSGGIDDVSLFMLTACDYTGTLRVGSRTYKLALADSNGNGIFGDRLHPNQATPLAQEVSRKSDRLFLGPGPSLSPLEDLRTSGFLGIEGLLYQVRFNQPRGKLLLEPLPAPRGRLAFPLAPDRIKLFGLEGAPDILYLEAGREIRVPLGSYRLGCYVLSRKDDGGNIWTLKAKAPPSAPPVKAREDKAEMLFFGPPYTPVVRVRARFPRRLRRRKVTAHLEFGVLGSGGEEVFFLSSPANRPSSIPRSKKLPDLPREPAFTILELPGETQVASGNFEYG